MKTIETQIKEAAIWIFGIGILCIALSSFAANADNACTPAPKVVKKGQKVARAKSNGNVTVIQNCGDHATKEVVVTKTVVVVREASKKKNSISLLGGVSPTSLSVTNNGGGNYSYQNNYQADAGLMFQRDLSDSIRGTLGGTVRGNAFLGLGLNF